MEYTALFRDKTYNGTLNIEQDKIVLDTNLDYNKIEIHYTKKMNIQSLLPGDCILEQNKLSSVITIHNKNKKNLTDLFNYKGKAVIYKCILFRNFDLKTNIYVSRSNLELWSTLSKTEKTRSSEQVIQDWASITKNWEDISFDGDNSKREYVFRKTTYDKDAKTFNTFSEIRKKNYG